MAAAAVAINPKINVIPLRRHHNRPLLQSWRPEEIRPRHHDCSVAVSSYSFFPRQAAAAGLFLSLKSSSYTSTNYAVKHTTTTSISIPIPSKLVLPEKKKNGRLVQRELNWITQVAKTVAPGSMSSVLTETASALLRHPDYWISGDSSVDVNASRDDAEKYLRQLSSKERGKLNEKTLVGVNSLKMRKNWDQRASGHNNKYIVVTVLVASEGVIELPSINWSKDLKIALEKLASIPNGRTLAVDVLWAPGIGNLSEVEYLQKYPSLNLI